MSVFDYRTDPGVPDYWDDDGGSCANMSTTTDGTGPAPTNGQAVNYWGGAKGLFYAVPRYNPTGSAPTSLGSPTLVKTYAGNTRAAVNYDGVTQAHVVGIGTVGSLGNPGVPLLPGLADLATNPSPGLNGTEFTLLVMFLTSQASIQANYLICKDVPAGNSRIGMEPGQFLHGGILTGWLTGAANGGDGRVHVQAYSYSASTFGGIYKTYLDGCGGPGAVTAAPPLDTTHPMTFGAGFNTGTLAISLPFHGQILKIVPVTRLLLPVAVLQFTDQCFDEYGLPRPRAGTKSYCILDSNSEESADADYSDGFAQAMGLPAPATATQYAGGATFNNSWGSRSGLDIWNGLATWTQALSLYLWQTDPQEQVYTYFELTNDASGGVVRTVDDALATAAAMRAFATANGINMRIVGATLMDRKTITPIVRRQINTRYLDYGPAFGYDAIVDWDNEDYVKWWSFDTGSASLDFAGDGTHFRPGNPALAYQATLARKSQSVLATPGTAATSVRLIPLSSQTSTSGGTRTVPGQRGLPWLVVPVGGVLTGTVTLNTGDAADNWYSPDATFTNNGSGLGTFDFTGGNADWRGRIVYPVPGPSTTARAVTGTATGLPGFSATITLTATVATGFQILGYSNGPSGAPNWPINVPLPPGHAQAIASSAMAAVSGTHNLTATITTGTGTVTWASSGTAVSQWTSARGEDYFTATATSAGTVVVTIADDGGYATQTLTFNSVSQAEGITVTAAAVTTNQPSVERAWAVTFAWVGIPFGQTRTLTPTDTGAGTFRSPTLTFGPGADQQTRSCILASPIPNPGTTHTISGTNPNSVSVPTTTIGVVGTTHYAFACTGATTLGPGQQTTFSVAPTATIQADGVGCGDGGGAHGTFAQTPTFNQSAVAQTFNYTAPGTPGTYAITPASDVGFTFSPASVTITVTGTTTGTGGISFDGGFSTAFEGGFAQ